ncbi:long-chain fatty acid--CoA ligase [Amycolatopsis antarctica]|uniref:Acyl-CoA synthetase n=1 Tax=Amycolatopsis antarctica TaxID=1854586 RepID=A0A263CY49_9PSEU|nr:AMP-dependent synthetase/ligase [Amycolatopsis antarctica]OZM70347.1 long-chain fatty acid--CoA ligase [Amycolatopsis antarctica]
MSSSVRSQTGMAEQATLSDLASESAATFGNAVAQRYPHDGRWVERTFAELHDAVLRVAGMLHEAGVRPGERVALLCATRAEWTVCDLAIARLGAVCVPVYPSGSDAQIGWVLRDSGAAAAIAETAAHLNRLEHLRERTPAIRVVLGVERATAHGPALAEVIDSASASGSGLPPAGTEPDLPFTIVYTSGTTGPPKGCVLSHRNVLSVVAMLRGISDAGPGDVVFAYLPLAHLFTRMLQIFCLRAGATIAYSGGDIRTVVAELAEVAPTHLPSVPAMFEKIHSLVTAQATARDPSGRELGEAVELGLRVRAARERGEPVTDRDQQRFDDAEQALFAPVRAVFGGRVRQALTGSAPIAADILRLFFACGVPVYEAYGMTESTAVISACRPGEWRPGTVGRPVPGVAVRIAADGEVCARSAGVFGGYWRDEPATTETIRDGWLHTGDLGELDEDGYLVITGRKKDLIITAAGKNLSPANLENDLRRTPWIADAVMLGDRRPHPVALIALDEDTADGLAALAGIERTGAWHTDPRLRAVLAADVERVNAQYAPAERIRDFAVVPRPFTVDSGELTPTLKVRRDVVAEHFAELVEALYSRPATDHAVAVPESPRPEEQKGIRT